MSKTLSVNEPAGTAAISLGDDQIRGVKQAIVDNLLENHVIEESSSGVYSGTDNGKHHKVDLFNRESGADYEDITTIEGYGIVYCFLTEYTTKAGTYSDHELYWAYSTDTETSSSETIRLTRAGNIDLDNGSLTNDTGLRARNFADTADIELIKVNEDDDRQIPGDLVISGDVTMSGALEWDSEITYGLRSIVAKTDDTQGECLYISLTAGNLNNDPSDVDNQYGETGASNPVWERLIKNRDITGVGTGVATVYGSVTSLGAVALAGSDNWTVSKIATGRYKLTITESGSWFVIASVPDISISTNLTICANMTAGVFANGVDSNIHIEGTGGTNQDSAWYFVAFKVA